MFYLRIMTKIIFEERKMDSRSVTNFSLAKPEKKIDLGNQSEKGEQYFNGDTY